MNFRKNKKVKHTLSMVRKFQTSIILALLGLAFIGAGLSATKLFSNPQEPEFIAAESKAKIDNTSQVVVDIAGAVKTPGVYTLPSSSRMNDVINKAGGFSTDADKDWIAKNINLANKIGDGQKIYIPRKGESGSVNSVSVDSSTQKTSLININSATESELDSLPGIGPVRAGKIIQNRPYSKPEELLSKKVLGEGTFEKIKDQISAY